MSIPAEFWIMVWRITSNTSARAIWRGKSRSISPKKYTFRGSYQLVVEDFYEINI